MRLYFSMRSVWSQPDDRKANTSATEETTGPGTHIQFCNVVVHPGRVVLFNESQL